MLAVVSGTAPITVPWGSAVEVVYVALVTVSVAGSATDVERRARALEAVAVEVETALGEGPFFGRFIP